MDTVQSSHRPPSPGSYLTTTRHLCLASVLRLATTRGLAIIVTSADARSIPLPPAFVASHLGNSPVETLTFVVASGTNPDPLGSLTFEWDQPSPTDWLIDYTPVPSITELAREFDQAATRTAAAKAAVSDPLSGARP